MQAEELIIRTSFQSADLTGAGFKVLVAAIANGFLQQTNRVQISTRDWAQQTGLTRESVRKVLTDELGPHLPVENLGKNANGRCGFILLPLGWISTQTRLSFMDDEGFPCLWKFPRKTENWPKNLATPPAKKVGQYRPGNWAGHTADDDGTGQKTGPVTPVMTMVPAQKVGQSGQETGPVSPETDSIYTRARVDRSIDQDCGETEALSRINTALQTVDFLPHRSEDAQLVRDWINAHRACFPQSFRSKPNVDRRMLAQILALAAWEDIRIQFEHLLGQNKPSRPGAQDAWYFTTLANRIYDVAPSVIDEMRQRAKKQRQNLSHRDGTPPLDGIDWSPNVLEFAKQKTRMPA